MTETDVEKIIEEYRKNTPRHTRLYYWFYRHVSDLRFFITRKLPCFFHRGRKGYSYIDTWSFDAYLCDVIVGGLKILKKNAHGCPPEFFDQDAENQLWKWEEVLERMIQGFMAGKAIVDSDYIDDAPDREERERRYDELEKIFNDGMDLFKEHFFSLWD